MQRLIGKDICKRVRTKERNERTLEKIDETQTNENN
jgi:hypothetical protein